MALDLSGIHTDSLSGLVTGKKAVFYEEMAEYSLRYMAGSFSGGITDLDSEVRYHLVNLTYLSFYFDLVLLQTSALFNLTDPFVSKVIQRTIASSRFQEMLRCGVIRIVGWGGTTPNEMFNSALDFASPIDSPMFSDLAYFTNIQRLFEPDTLAYRSTGTPDQDVDEPFKVSVR